MLLRFLVFVFTSANQLIFGTGLVNIRDARATTAETMLTTMMQVFFQEGITLSVHIDGSLPPRQRERQGLRRFAHHPEHLVLWAARLTHLHLFEQLWCHQPQPSWTGLGCCGFVPGGPEKYCILPRCPSQAFVIWWWWFSQWNSATS